MSMSAEQRRTEVLERKDYLGSASLRIAKASSRFDRRHRFYVVETLPPLAVGSSDEDMLWWVMSDWPVASSHAELLARAYYSGAKKMLSEIVRWAA